MSVIDFGREVTADLDAATTREWLVTNGLGGYASGTVSGIATRRYHGLLVSAERPPVGRTMLLSQLDETVTYRGRSYALATNEWASGQIAPRGHLHIDRFHLDGMSPVWTYAFGDAVLEKRVWMEPGENATFVRYRVVAASEPLSLSIKVLVEHRDHHHLDRAHDRLSVRNDGDAFVVCEAQDVLRPVLRPVLRIVGVGLDGTPDDQWYRDYSFRAEAARGLDSIGDRWHPVVFDGVVSPGASVGIVAASAAAALPSTDLVRAWLRRRAYDRDLMSQAGLRIVTPEVRQLVLAADQFVVERPFDGAAGKTILAGYPWFTDWGRDTMIALSGLTLSTGRPTVAAEVIRTFGRFVDRGMLPNRFPEGDEAPEFNTVDATLWFFEAIRAHRAATNDDSVAVELFETLVSIIDHHEAGTRYGIHVDPADGLVAAGEPGVQLTWMDAKVGDWVVTPRIGKPVEINALWFNALSIMVDLAEALDESAERFVVLRDRVQASFRRFDNPATGGLFDVIDGPDGDDGAIRPNQIFAVSLHHSALPLNRQKAVVDVCTEHLYTGYGLRSLAPSDPNYCGRYEGGVRSRDGAYHQGTVWGWLIGAYVDACRRVNPAFDAQLAVAPLARHVRANGLGTLAEIFDGDPPFTPRGCIAQAWTVAEVLRVLTAPKRP